MANEPVGSGFSIRRNIDNFNDVNYNFNMIWRIMAGHIGTPNLLDKAITSLKISDLAVGTVQIGNLAITTAKIDNLAVTEAKIGNLAITTAKIDNLAVTEAKIGSLAVTEAKIGNLAISTAKIAELAVTEAKIGSLAVTEAKIGSLAVTEAKIGNLAVTTGKINDLAITTLKIENLAITEAKIGNLAIGTAKIQDLAITEAKIGNLAVTTAKIDSLAVTEAKIAALAVTNAKINDLAAGKITAGTIAASVEMTAATITGGLIRTDATGKRIEITSSGLYGRYASDTACFSLSKDGITATDAYLNFYNSSGVNTAFVACLNGVLRLQTASGYNVEVSSGAAFRVFSAIGMLFETTNGNIVVDANTPTGSAVIQLLSDVEAGSLTVYTSIACASFSCTAGATGTFTTVDGKSVAVQNGLVTAIV